MDNHRHFRSAFACRHLSELDVALFMAASWAGGVLLDLARAFFGRYPQYGYLL
jgi:hypothetical protein